MSFTLKGTENLSVKEKYDFIKLFIKGQVRDESDSLALMANISAIIMALVSDLNWAGFYLVQGDQLVLGPFQGLPACTRLDYDKGVCAKAWRDKEPVLVEDVHAFPGHVACDSASNSELVIPLIKDGQVYGVLDLDSPKPARFTKDDQEEFVQIVEIFQDHLI
ncbi:GAF domain-containing protein [Neofamilia massiliensis]|uniref:GAF domain-containing protein n=1 Tax=Neofamilia massiliensis TaxID=1673724 RepID=UPI0006BB8BD8|nr:GAF domain-containing protein [Neofamilia massiliensis]